MSSLTIRIALKNVPKSLTMSRPLQTATASMRVMSTRRLYSSMHENDPEVLEREKRRNLSRVGYQTSAPVDDAPGWNELLATNAEASVKADRTPNDASVADLVRRTVAHMKAKNSPEERFEGSEATYDRDEISGPLRGAGRGVSSIETDGYEEEMEKVDGEWHRSTVKKHTEVVMDLKEAVEGKA